MHTGENPLKQLVTKSVFRGSVPEEVSAGEVCACGTVLIGGQTVTVRVRPASVRKQGANSGKKDVKIESGRVDTNDSNGKTSKKGKKSNTSTDPGGVPASECVATCTVCGRESVEALGG